MKWESDLFELLLLRDGLGLATFLLSHLYYKVVRVLRTWKPIYWFVIFYTTNYSISCDTDKSNW